MYTSTHGLTAVQYGAGWRLTWTATQLLLEELAPVVTPVGEERRRLRQLLISSPGPEVPGAVASAFASGVLVSAAKLESRDDYLKASRRIKSVWVAALDKHNVESSVAPLRERRIYRRRVAPRGFDHSRFFTCGSYTLVSAWGSAEAARPDGSGRFVVASEAGARKLYLALSRGVELPETYRALLDLLRALHVPVRAQPAPPTAASWSEMLAAARRRAERAVE